MSSSSKDYYIVMGLNAKATPDEIKKRYRELARRYHPDVNSKPDAAQKIKEINAAYAVLGDSERRATYDADRIFQANINPTPSASPRPATPSQPPRSTSTQPPRPTGNMGNAAGSRPFRPGASPYRSASNQAEANKEDVNWDALLYGRRAEAGGRDDTPRRTCSATNAARPYGQTGGGQGANNANRQQAAAERKAAERAGEVKQLVKEAQLAFINRQYAEATDFCRQAMRLDSRNAVAYELLGDAARKQGNTEEAIQAYSIAVQLNPRNQSVQANLDRLLGVGNKSASPGPTFARTPQVPLTQRLGSETMVNGVGAASLVGLGICVAGLYMFPGAGILAGLSANLLIALMVSGVLGGVLLALYGGMRPQSQELATRGEGGSPIPLNGVLAMLALVWFFVSLLAYIAVSVTQNRVSASVLRAYALTLVLNVVFVVLYHPQELTRDSGFSVPTAAFAGNLLFPAILLGWKIGDALRLGRYGGS